MSIDVVYQGLTIAKGASYRFEQGGLLVQTDGPMPVATQLTLIHEAGSLVGRVRRVFERSTATGEGTPAVTTPAAMLIVPATAATAATAAGEGGAQTQAFPRWMKQLVPEGASVSGIEFEAEPPPPVPASVPAATEPTTPAHADADSGAEASSGDATPASAHTPSEGAGGEEEDDGKTATKKTSTTASKTKKKPRKR